VGEHIMPREPENAGVEKKQKSLTSWKTRNARGPEKFHHRWGDAIGNAGGKRGRKDKSRCKREGNGRKGGFEL